MEPERRVVDLTFAPLSEEEKRQVNARNAPKRRAAASKPAMQSTSASSNAFEAPPRKNPPRATSN